MVRSSLIHDLRYPIGERTEDYVGMSGDPPNVCSAPVDVVILHIEDIFTGGITTDQISPTGMQDSLRLPG